MKQVLAFTAFLVCFVSSVVAVYWEPIISVLRGPRPGAVLQQKLVESGNTRVRVLALREEGGLMPAMNGAYYRFQVLNETSGEWKEIMTSRHDDPNPIPESWIAMNGSKTIVVFINAEYSISVDGGETWTRRTLCNTYPKRDACRYSCIAEMEIRPDGKGTAELSGRDDQLTRIETSDFGGSWVDAQRRDSRNPDELP